MAKRKRTSLPRVTVLAMSRRELVAFVSAVEQLRLLVQDLTMVAAELKAKKPRKPAAIAAAIAAEVPVPKGGAT